MNGGACGHPRSSFAGSLVITGRRFEIAMDMSVPTVTIASAVVAFDLPAH